METFWNAFKLSDESHMNIRKHLSLYQREDNYYDLVIVAVVSMINQNSDQKFWDSAFGETRTPEEINVIKFETLKRSFSEYYQFFIKNSMEFPKESKVITQIAKDLFELKGDEEHLKNLTKNTKVGVIGLLFQIWARNLFKCSDKEYDTMLERIYK